MKFCGYLGFYFKCLTLLVFMANPQAVLAAGKQNGSHVNPHVKNSVVSKSADERADFDSNSEYSKVLSRLEQLDASGQRTSLVESGFFQSLSWIGRTACINYVCGIHTIDYCRKVLSLGLADDALVVRDHALRITISTQHFSEEEKRQAAEKAVNDDRNYRKGRPFWIVDRARGFLVAEGKASTPR
ncbi:MAG: hypothetical protein RI953_3059 [Pseudomonadota bacterium]|jgi:hypothetical protein